MSAGEAAGRPALSDRAHEEEEEKKTVEEEEDEEEEDEEREEEQEATAGSRRSRADESRIAPTCSCWIVGKVSPAVAAAGAVGGVSGGVGGVYLSFSSCVTRLVNLPQSSPMRKSSATPAPIIVRM